MKKNIEKQLTTTIGSLTLYAKMMERYAYLPTLSAVFYREKLSEYALCLRASIIALKHVEALIQETHPMLKGGAK